MKHIANQTLFTAIFFLILGVPLEGVAQFYFGRNKVQYEDFSFRTIKTDRFDVYYYPSEEQPARDAAVMAERWYARLSGFFGHQIQSRQPLILYANHADFQQTNVISGLIGPGTGGVTEGIKNRIVLPLTGSYAANDHVIGHELVHAFQYDIVKSRGGKLSDMGNLPLWFIEGMAEYLSVGRVHPLTTMWLRDAVLNNDVPTLAQMSRNPRYFPYRFGHAFWAYVAGKWGDEIIPTIYNSVIIARLDTVMVEVLGNSMESLSEGFITSIKETYAPQIEGRTAPKDLGKPILTNGGGINLAPVISPNGRYVAFLSRRDLFTVDLFLADAQTGKVIKKLASSNTDSHFDALRFIDSAGSWSPDGSKFAFVVFKDGDNAIAILDVSSRDIKRTIKVKDVDAISNLAWSPDGQRLAFSGTAGGINDLYLYHLGNQTATQLTNDRFAELQPAWAPDGESIAYVTDRGPQTDFDQFTYGEMKIGIMDLQSRNVDFISMSDEIKHINPQFSVDGRDIYFIADPDGFSDIYRYSKDTGEFIQITRIATGITGITEYSPALSVAPKSGDLVFSVFQATNYQIHALEPENTGGIATDGTDEDLSKAALPPLRALERGITNAFLEQPEIGLPEPEDFTTSDYDASLGLVSVGRTAIGASVDRFGTAVGGAVSFLFSDMLGHRNLGVAAQVNGGIKDLGGQVIYQNRSNRWNWGVMAGHIPYLTGFTSVGIDTAVVGGDPIPVRSIEFIKQRVYTTRAGLMTEYAISTNRRFEFSTGFTRISYGLEAEEILTTLDGRTIIDQEEVDREAPSGVNLVQSSVAYVGDYSFFGFTSPVNGSRYRFEVEPTFGTLRYLTLLIDYRKYFFMQPFTFGIRAMHIGRYLEDSENRRLSPLFLGFETFVRGYDVNSFDFNECAQTGDLNSCPEFDRLTGSKMGVFNAEFRLPLFGNEQFGLINFPTLATELSVFLDAGVAWTEDEAPTFDLKKRSADRIPVFSTGLAARVNLGGFLPMQVFYAYPFQRPDKGWEFGFVIAPGW